MKWFKLLKKLLVSLLVLVTLIFCGIYFFLKSSSPDYSEEIQSDKITEGVEVYYDEFGIPHIYAQSGEDAYFALGYTHAKDRLFQMELLRRVGAGELSGMLGSEFIRTDHLLRSLEIRRKSKEAAAKHFTSLEEDWKKFMVKYVEGINHFQNVGKTPAEFYLLGLDKRDFTVEDAYMTVGYMGFSFGLTLRTEPLFEKVFRDLGNEYLSALSIDYNCDDFTVPIDHTFAKDSLILEISNELGGLIEGIPLPEFVGSNSWVIGPKKTKSGKSILCNDTHIGYSQPSIWYESHVSYPGYHVYGNYLPGFPFPLVGHNEQYALGITMLENDDMDIYYEVKNSENDNQVRYEGDWYDMEIYPETLSVKGGKDTVVYIRKTKHGSILSGLVDRLPLDNDTLYSFYWSFRDFEHVLPELGYYILGSKDMEEIKNALSKMYSPGLNVLYADTAGNIAWWAAAKILQRPVNTQPKLFLDGTSSIDEPLGYYDFADNPSEVNPERGYIVSANTRPDSGTCGIIPGYYVPDHRAKRIDAVLRSHNDWDVDKAKKLITDVTSTDYAEISRIFCEKVSESSYSKSETHQLAYDSLKNWNGVHHLNCVGPTIFYKMIYLLLYQAMEDEMGDQWFQDFKYTHAILRTIPVFIRNDSTTWWDDLRTPQKENMADMVNRCFLQGVDELSEKHGRKVNQWLWKKEHFIEHPHAMGKQKPLNLLYNVGPYPSKGGNEVINNVSFKWNKESHYIAGHGPAMRRVVDLSDTETSWSILPTGQSGVLMSPHYDDQAEMYNRGEFREQLMGQDVIVSKQKSLTTFKPLQ